MSTYAWDSIDTVTRRTDTVWATDVSGVTRIGRQHDSIVIPAFSVSYTETDSYMPFVVGEFSITMASHFALSPRSNTAGGTTYGLGVRDNSGQHFILQLDDTADLQPAGIPRYAGETLGESVVFEVWSNTHSPITSIAEATASITLQTSLLSTTGTAGTAHATGSIITALFALGTPGFALPMTFNSEQA